MITYSYLPPTAPPTVSNAADMTTLNGIVPAWSQPYPLLNRYVFEPAIYLGWLVGITAGDSVLAPASMNVVQTGFTDTTGGVSMSDLSGHVTIYISGLVSPFVYNGQLLEAGTTVLGLSTGNVFFQVAYLNRVFDPSTLPQLSVVGGNAAP